MNQTQGERWLIVASALEVPGDRSYWKQEPEPNRLHANICILSEYRGYGNREGFKVYFGDSYNGYPTLESAILELDCLHFEWGLLPPRLVRIWAGSRRESKFYLPSKRIIIDSETASRITRSHYPKKSWSGRQKPSGARRRKQAKRKRMREGKSSLSAW